MFFLIESMVPELADNLLFKYAMLVLLMTLRYIVFAGFAYLLFYVIFKKKMYYRKIQQKWPDAKRIWHEVKYSLSTFTIISMLIIGGSFLYKAGLTSIYLDINEHSLFYLVFSAIAAIFIHDTYFYWSHRLMHHPKLFKHVHKVHHMSHNPSPWAAFSFHPTEAVVEFGFVIPMVMLLSLHPLALLTFSLYMITLNVMGHLGFELFPKGATKHWLLKWQNTSTHHNMHHKYVNCNYGLYFNIWDRMMKTNHSKYHETFDAIKNRPKQDDETEASNEGVTVTLA